MSKGDKQVVWAFVGSLFAVKFLTSLLVLYYFPSWHTLLIVVALSFFWFVPPIYYFSTHSKGHIRLLKARARRKELLRQEWDVEERLPTKRL